MNSTLILGVLFTLIASTHRIHGSLLTQGSNLDHDVLDQKDMASFRLPNSTKPIEQLIRLQPFINGNNSIKGYTEITFEVLHPTSNVTLHMADIITLNDTITISPTNKTDEQIPIVKHIYDAEKQFYVAMLSVTLDANKTYVLSMSFVGYLNENLVGFYRSFYTEANGKKSLFAVSQFASNFARYAFPCYDEPAMKAKFKIQLAREDTMIAASNMPRLTSEPIDGQAGWILDTFQTSLPMSSYLVTFLVSDFVNTNSTKDGQVSYRIWVREALTKQTSYALSISPLVMNYFEKHYNILYPLPKQDMAAVPDFFYGGMENWGLINYRESDLLYDPLVSSAEDIQRTCVIVAHELAHNWHGNLVTMKWWNNVWLNEGFATFMEYLGCDSVEPSFKVKEQFTIDDLHKAFAVDSLESSHPVNNPITSPEQIHDVYDTMAYSKAGSLIRMMNSFLTPTTFQKGVTNFLTNFSYSNANEEDFWPFLTEQGHTDGTLPKGFTVKEIMDTWTTQSGYPVLTVQRFTNNTASLTQKRFLSSKSENSLDPRNYSWWIPLTYVTQDSPNFNQTMVLEWMKNTEKDKTLTGLPSKDKWVIFNVQQNGYYRVNYDAENWNALIKQMNKDNTLIGTLNRAQILDDAYNFAKAGVLSYETALSMNTYLNQEEEYVPMKAALKQLEYLNYMFVRTSKYISMKMYMTDLLVPLYENVGFEDNPNDPHQEQLKRSLIIAWTCKMGYKPCIQNSISLFNGWMENPTNNSIRPNSRRAVYCTSIGRGDEREWDFAYAQYLKTDVGNEKDNLLYGMGCAKQIWIIQRYLEMTFNEASGIRKQDVDKVFSSVSQTVLGNVVAWDYLRNQRKQIIEYSGSNSIVSLTKIVTSYFNTNQQLEELEQFQKNLGPTINLQQSIEKTKNNIEWMTDYFDVIAAWLTANGYGDNITKSLN